MKKKSFDCVQMKWDIQRKQREELTDKPETERRRIQLLRAEADPILGPFIRRIRQSSAP